MCWRRTFMEQKQTGRLIRPSARYVGPNSRPVSEVTGAADVFDKEV